MAWQFWRAKTADSSNASAARAPTDEERLRVTARRRLIGAAVLVGLTVLIFPWVFKQQPRPINDDLIIEVPRKDAAKPLSATSTNSINDTASAAAAAKPATEAPVAAPSAPPSPPPSAAASAAPSVAAPVAAAVVAAAAVTAAAAKPEAKPMVKDAAKAPLTEAPKPVAKDSSKDTNKTATPTAPTSKPVDASNASSTGARYVVQVAAFAEAAKAREVRIKLEAQGYKTYSQAIDSPKGKVWRVRVGPFDNKAAAEKAKSQLSGKGFQPALLEL
jgi:DedD protein